MVGILAAFVVLLAGFAAVGLWWWFGFTLALLALLDVFEWLSVRRTGLTLSGQYTKLVREKPIAGGVINAIVGGFFGYLLFHLVSGW
jgi:uncharacterized protein (DUF697 family)